MARHRDTETNSDRDAQAGRPPLVVLLLVMLVPTPTPAEQASANRYVRFIDELMARWPEPALDPASGGDGLVLTCIETPGQERYVGARQEVLIRASLAAVAATLDDVPHYRDLYPDLVEVRVVEGDQEGARYLTTWERRVPLFFVPNTRFTLVHEVDRSRVDRLVYRYHLQSSERLTHTDGVTVLELVGPEVTRLVEYDFFDAHWGPLPVSLIWRESLRGIFLSDMSVKVRSEHPAWTYPQVRHEVERLWKLDARLVERCRGSRQLATLP